MLEIQPSTSRSLHQLEVARQLAKSSLLSNHHTPVWHKGPGRSPHFNLNRTPPPLPLLLLRAFSTTFPSLPHFLPASPTAPPRANKSSNKSAYKAISLIALISLMQCFPHAVDTSQCWEAKQSSSVWRQRVTFFYFVGFFCHWACHSGLLHNSLARDKTGRSLDTKWNK